ncbi:unnamed protein product, partial [marine sediment metagenome]
MILNPVLPAQEIWEAALGELRLQVTGATYRTWLEKTVGLSYQGNQFVVDVPNHFVAEYLSRNQRPLIEKTLAGLTHLGIKVHFWQNTCRPSKESPEEILGQLKKAWPLTIDDTGLEQLRRLDKDGAAVAVAI